MRPLSMIFLQSWESWEVSVNWKPANIGSIFKKGKKDNPGNYRPVRLISVHGKIMEKIILEVIEKHLKYNTVTGHSQHGLMRERSCLTSFISFQDMVTYLIDQGKPEDAIWF